MFTAALLRIIKTCKQLKRPSTDAWTKKMRSIRIMGYYKAFRREEMQSFGTTWISLEDTTLSETGQIENNNYFMTPLITGLYVKVVEAESKILLTRRY